MKPAYQRFSFVRDVVIRKLLCKTVHMHHSLRTILCSVCFYHHTSLSSAELGGGESKFLQLTSLILAISWENQCYLKICQHGYKLLF